MQFQEQLNPSHMHDLHLKRLDIPVNVFWPQASYCNAYKEASATTQLDVLMPSP